MHRENSASGNNLGRRRFLGGFFGSGTGATVFGAVPTGPSAGRNAGLFEVVTAANERVPAAAGPNGADGGSGLPP